MKSTPEEIRRRFDADVERFADLEAGHAATMDARLTLDLLTRAAAAATPGARRLLDVGCGAGNYSLKLLQHLPGLDVTLLDLSRPMLDRAEQRVRAATTGLVTPVQSIAFTTVTSLSVRSAFELSHRPDKCCTWR